MVAWLNSALSKGVDVVGLSAGFALAGLPAEEAIPALRPPRPELRPSFLDQYGWLVVVAVAVGCAAIAGWARWRARPKPVVILPPDALARNSLEGLRARTEDVALAAEVSRILRRYVTAAFNLPPDELTPAELQRALKDSRTSPDLVSAINAFLRRCDEWKFAPVPSCPLRGVIGGALELIDKTEASRKQTIQAPQPQPVT